MATASRTRQPPGAKPSRPRPPSLTALRARDALETWLVPTVAAAVIVLCAALSATELVATEAALAGALAAALVLLLFIGERPLLTGDQPRRARWLGGALAAVWLVACSVPFYTRIFPGAPLVDAAQLTAAGGGLPLRIPAAGHAAVDLLLEGKLTPGPAGGTAPPVHYQLTVAAPDGVARVVEGLFEDTLRTRRLGRRGTAVVHQLHTADLRIVANPGQQELTVTRLVLDPASAQPVTLSAYAHPLPSTPILALAAAALLAAVVAFDRLGPAPETDGALTLATAAVLGTATIFWTSDTVHPDFRNLIGAAIFGGPLGFAAGALVWWVAKRLIARPTR